jgi:sensor histidine kinase YesM
MSERNYGREWKGSFFSGMIVGCLLTLGAVAVVWTIQMRQALEMVGRAEKMAVREHQEAQRQQKQAEGALQEAQRERERAEQAHREAEEHWRQDRP